MSEITQNNQDVMTDQKVEEAGSLKVKSQTLGTNPLVNLISHLSIMQMTLAVLVVIFLWQWFDANSQISQMQQELAKRLAEMDGVNKAQQTLAAQSQETVRELGGKLSLLESKYAESQNQRAALETLYQEMSSSRDQTALAEAEQMLMIAGQQLQLSANVKAALIAMQHADTRLQRLDRAALSGLRRSINQDIEKLRALPNIDESGINVRLDGLIALVDTLPLSQDVRTHEQIIPVASATTENAWDKFWRELWTEAKQLVRIENTQKREMPLLSPTQTFFLKENLKIRLLSARLAVLSHEELGYKRDLKTAEEWVKLYFEADSKDGAAMLATLKKLSSSNINIEMPDISGSLDAVRNYRVTHEKAVR
ncbi:MAG: uroporphyrinogen-III C-methyltransferase [Gallionellaceae bacterium]